MKGGRVKALWRRFDFDVRDFHAYGGLALVAWGAWLAYPPAGPIVFGFGMMYFTLKSPHYGG